MRNRRYPLPRFTMSFLLLAFSLFGSQVSAYELPEDPYGSVMWNTMASRYFPGEVVFDQRVKVYAPTSAENQFHVPVTVDATELEDVVEVVALADLNPIPHILTVRPIKALSFIGFRLKLQQSSPLHVGVRTADGVWHVGGAYVDAAGGGCTAPAAAHGNSNWMKTLGETRALARRDNYGNARVMLRMRHPMDTGLASGIPAFYMNEVVIKDGDGNPLAELDLFEPVSENPTVTLKAAVDASASQFQISTRDTEGNVFEFPLDLPARGTP